MNRFRALCIFGSHPPQDGGNVMRKFVTLLVLLVAVAACGSDPLAPECPEESSRVEVTAEDGETAYRCESDAS